MSEVQLGLTYEDAVTGFTGVAVAVTEYLQGCRRVTLERADEKGKPESFAFDEPNLVSKKTGRNVLGKIAPRTATGGPHDHESAVSH